MANGQTGKGARTSWRVRFIVTITLVDAYIWFVVVPQYVRLELRDPWFYVLYYFAAPALWLFFCWQFLDSK
ncbi:MAG: hypothetical protein MUD10_04965 [Candidatus Pacebacteria bacterium]|nr:hypothetical protein [Candidatus Paceibacterota bacterium]